MRALSKRIGRLTTILLVILLLPPVLFASPPQASPAVRQARAFIRRGWVLRAIAVLERARAANPRSVEILTELGVAEERQGRFDRAISAYEAVAGIDPSNANALERLGVLYSWEKETWPKAIERLSSLVTIAPDSPARKTLGDLYSWTERHAEAEAEYRAMLALGEDLGVRIALARSLVWQQKPGEARVLFDSLRAEGAAFDEASQYADALAYLQSEDYDAAERAFTALVSSYPTNSKYAGELQRVRDERAGLPRRQAGKLLETAREAFRAGRVDEAFTAFDEALKLDPSAETRLEYSDLLSSVESRRPSALEQLELVTPRTLEVERRRARLLASFPDRRPEALDLYLSVLRGAASADTALRGELVDLLSWMPASGKALDVGLIIVERWPEAVRLRPRIARELALADCTPADAPAFPCPQPAIRLLERAAANGTLAPDEMASLGIAYSRDGRPREARAMLERAAAASPSAEVLERLGWMYLEDGEAQIALVTFDRAIVADVTAPGPRNGRANALLALDRPLSAVEAALAPGPVHDLNSLAEGVRVHRRAEARIAELTVRDEVGMGVTAIHRSGEEAATATSTGEDLVDAVSVFALNLRASGMVSDRVGVFGIADVMRYEAGELGELNGVDGSAGIAFLASDSMWGRLGLGATAVGEVTFLTRLDGKPSNRMRAFVEASRSPLTESFFTYAGVVDPLTDERIGRVMALGGGGGVDVELERGTNLVVHGRVDRLSGEGEAGDNVRVGIGASLGHDMRRTYPSLSRFAFFRPSVQIAVLAFDRDANTIPLSNGTLVRGYFSPELFVSPGVRLDLGWKREDAGLEVVAGAGVSGQYSKGDASRFFKPRTSVGVDASGLVRWRPNIRWSFHGQYQFSNSGAEFRQQTLTAGATISF